MTGPEVVRELLLLSQLTRLELSQPCVPNHTHAGLPAGLPALLLCLPALQHVGLCSEYRLPAGSMEALAQLGKLTALRLQGKPLPDPGPLTRLPHLRRLALVDRGFWQDEDDEARVPPLVLPPPSAFQQAMEEFSCNTICRGLQVG